MNLIDSDPRFSLAVAAFRARSAEDPAREVVGSHALPRELVQADRLSEWVKRLAPDASPALRLAAFAQHVGRFGVPRSSYPAGRVGYLRWRTDLAKRHAQSAAEVLTQVGYDAELIARVRTIVLKQGRTQDAEVQLMEDALCLSFLEHEYALFSEGHEDDKVITILRKSWGKMSELARQRALTLVFSGRPQALLERALSPDGDAG